MAGYNAPEATVRIGEIEFTAMSFDRAVDWVLERAVARRGGTVVTPNADFVVRAHRDASFRRLLEAFDLRVPDGMGVIYAGRLAGRPLRQTVTGRLLLPAVAARAAKSGLPLALFGAGPDVAAEAGRRLQRRCPGLEIPVAITPPYPIAIGSAADQRQVAEIAASRARVVFVGLSAPKGEAWIQAHRAELGDRVLVGVGAALDIIAGRFREAPAWMTRLGVEWLFRLAQEPRRLTRRYLVDDPWIFWWALRARFSVEGRSPGGTPGTEPRSRSSQP